MKTLRLILAGEQALFRAGLRCMLERARGVRVVGETRSGREAVVLARNLHPDLVILESELIELNGPEAIGQILHWSPESRVIMVIDSLDGRLESRAIEAGAAGVLSKSASSRDLDRLLGSLREGNLVPAPVELAASRPGRRSRANSTPLTPRQLEVLKLLSEGSGVKRIARILGISPKTVETHRAQLMDRLHIYDLAGLVRYALRERISRL